MPSHSIDDWERAARASARRADIKHHRRPDRPPLWALGGVALFATLIVYLCILIGGLTTFPWH